MYIFFLPVVYSTDLGFWSLKAEFVDIAKMRCPDERGLLLQAPQDPKDSSCLSTEDQYHQTNIYAISAAQEGEVNMPLGEKKAFLCHVWHQNCQSSVRKKKILEKL